MVRRIEAAQRATNPTVTCTGQWNGEICLRPDWLQKPLHWRKPLVILVQTLGDLFHEGVPFEHIAAVYGVMAACPQHTFLTLTKRPERMLEFHRWLSLGALDKCACHADDVLAASLSRADRALALASGRGSQSWPLPGVFAGISAEDQPTLDARWEQLQQVPAAHYWMSAEPLLAPVDFQRVFSLRITMPSFIAVGSETGTGARPCNVEWIRSVVRQCRDAGVPVHVKAVPVDGKPSKDPSEWPKDLRVRDEVPRG
jgi:protein gp37